MNTIQANQANTPAAAECTVNEILEEGLEEWGGGGGGTHLTLSLPRS